MSSNTGIVGMLGKAEVGALEGVHRSRFSLHMRTHRVRRWLLVQFVSVPVPVDEAQEDKATKAVRSARQEEKLRAGMDRIRDEYRMSQPVRMGI